MRFIFFCSVLLMPGTVTAQTPSMPPFAVEDAVDIAVRKNPRLSAAAREVAAAQYGVRSAGSLANLTFVFTPGVTSVSGSGDEVILSQPLEINGARAARSGLAGAQLRAAHAEAVGELRSLVFNTRTAYYRLVQARDLLSLSRASLHTAEEFDRITRRLVESGKRPGIESAQTGIEVARAQQQVTIADSREVVARATLNTLLARPAETPVGDLTPLSPTADTLNESALLQQALDSRAEIAGAQAARDSFQQAARLARAEGRPDLAPQVRFGSLVRGVPAAGSGDGFGIGIGVTLPIFDYGNRRNRIRQSEESARAHTDRITAAQDQVRQEVTQAVAGLRSAQSVALSYRQGVLDRAGRLLDASRTGLQEGQTSIVAVIEAQRTYRAVQTDYIDTLVSLALARAELERAVGSVPASLLLSVNPNVGRIK